MATSRPGEFRNPKNDRQARKNAARVRNGFATKGDGSQQP